MVFLEREFTVGIELYTMRTSGETDVRFRLKLKITSVESTYPSQRPDCPSLSPYFLLWYTNMAAGKQCEHLELTLVI